MKKLTFCPKCSKATLSYKNERCFLCSSCGFKLYNNIAAAVALIVPFVDDNGDVSVLLVKRGKNPRKGFYALPGGFIDADESAEQACKRECFEETGITPSSLFYLCSHPNTYEYAGITYKTCDMFFMSENILLSEKKAALFLKKLKSEDKDEIKGYELFPCNSKEDISNIPIAFDSALLALECFRNKYDCREF